LIAKPVDCSAPKLTTTGILATPPSPALVAMSHRNKSIIGGRSAAVLVVAVVVLLLASHSARAAQLPNQDQKMQLDEQQQQAANNQEIGAKMNAQQAQSFFSLKALFSGPQRTPFSDRKCLMCRFSVSLINYAIKTKRGQDQIDRIASTFCRAARFESAQVCSQVSKLFNHEITKVIAYGFMTPNQVCGLLSNNTCGHFHSPLDDWEVNLEASHHLDQDELARMMAIKTKTRDTLKGAKPYRVVHISDTHVDTRYKPGAPVNCQEPLCCHASSTPLNGSTLGDDQPKAGHWGSYGQCDIPLWTFESTLKFIKALIDDSNDIEYIVWTGDIQPHDVWAQNKKSAIQLYDTVFAKIFKYLPKIKILPTLGNHEMVPVDSFSPSNLLEIARDDSPVWLYKKLDSFWSRWLPKDTFNTITRDGFYAATIRPGLKVVSLNTNFCHTNNFWLYINSTDPGNQLQWLVHELQMSELIDEKVHILGHIPPGSEDCMKVWSKNYNRILRRFKRTITGQFFGHTHYNEFEMFYEQVEPETSNVKDNSINKRASESRKRQVSTSAPMLNTTTTPVVNVSSTTSTEPDPDTSAPTSYAKNITLKPIGVGFVGPSITTFVNLNPSFRIYNVDPRRDFMPTDFETYFMNLTSANMNATQEPEWMSSGTFSKTFGLNDTSPESMHELLLDIASDFSDAEEDEEGLVEGGEEEADEVPASSEAPASSSSPSSSTTTVTSTTTATTSNSTVTSTNSTSVPDKATNEVANDGEDEEEEEADGDDRLFELYWMYNSYSDAFNRTIYDQITLEDRRKFLCRLFTGQSHDPLACNQFVPVVTLFKIASDLVEV
jgi:hypothetical protein